MPLLTLLVPAGDKTIRHRSENKCLMNAPSLTQFAGFSLLAETTPMANSYAQHAQGPTRTAVSHQHFGAACLPRTSVSLTQRPCRPVLHWHHGNCPVDSRLRALLSGIILAW